MMIILQKDRRKSKRHFDAKTSEMIISRDESPIYIMTSKLYTFIISYLHVQFVIETESEIGGETYHI